tara:strand:+ start:51 stop:545 length:495 start_codon:yes stop_codon:yes gene_type:complete
MKKLPIKLKRLIKNKTFNTDTTHNRERWHRGGLQINSRITWIKVDNEDYYENVSPTNPGWNTIHVNIKVSGLVEQERGYRNGLNPTLKDIKEVVKSYKRIGGDRDGWGSHYTNRWDNTWGYQAHKRIRSEIRNVVKQEIKDYLKLLGISSDNKWDGVVINKVNF